MARKVVGVHRQHRRVDADDGGRAARHRLPARRDSHRRLLRRSSSRQQPVRAKAWSPSICRPASASGTTSSCTIRSGTTTCRARRSWSTSPSTAARSPRWRSRPSRASSSCSIARPASRCGRSKSVPVEKGTVPREWYSPTQPFPTKPPSVERQGFLPEYVIDFTPELKAEGLALIAEVQDRSDLHAADRAGRRRQGRACCSSRTARTGPAARSIPKPGMLYIYSHTLVRVLSMVNDPKRSDMNYISDGGASEDGGGRTERAGPAVDQTAVRAHQRRRSQQGRDRLADRARRDAGQRSRTIRR